MSGIDWNDPAARSRLIDRVGIAEYNRLHADQMARDAVVTVNGHRIRKVGSRFGTLFAVDGTGKAFRTIEEATAFASKGESE